MNQPHRQDLQPLKTNDTATILAGMALWAVALVVLLILQPGPEDRWWIWTCLSGIGLGVFGLWYVRRRDRRGPLPPSQEPIEPATAVSSPTAQEPVGPGAAMPSAPPAPSAPDTAGSASDAAGSAP
ncbi:DUF2530 domain-containing protein [Planobispora longispora]|uniref:DUF2530 domain-containing protein n=1 Tax=Planobispora longispora TaxID=28887 RepID=A0A8J3W6H6_9ACTN|nr:DUF2530 domain-containing protein [Planobispora longispora]GIH78499.1 hypothetical protein Plo01_49280 [Planobispora longispora]